MASSDILPNLTITFMIENKGSFLLVSRGSSEENFASMWAFPGGKSDVGETAIETIRREVKEEAGLEIGEHGEFLNSYCFGTSVGITFLVQVDSREIVLSDELEDYVWVSSLGELEQYTCIPGIYNHLRDALRVLENGQPLRKLEDMNLVKESYINK